MANDSLQLLPVTTTLQPADAQELAAAVRDCFARDAAVYPVGGRTSLDFGLPPRKPGVAMSLSGMHRVVDYPARDMTVTVEAGCTMQALAELLRSNRQRLPLDVPHPTAATIGGVVATNWNGPRRYGQGTVRDHVIGIQAVDGRGVLFKGGGRVVKNVAGYDFCKLLTGSLGTLGVITQVTLKLKPQPERMAVLVGVPRDLAHAESVLAAIVHAPASPVAVELLAGPDWRTDPALAAAATTAESGLYLAVALEGTRGEVGWLVDQLGRQWWELGLSSVRTLLDTDAAGLMERLAEAPAAAAPLVVKASVVPSAVTSFMATVQQLDPACSIQAHAGNGIVFARFPQVPQSGIARAVIGPLQQAATKGRGTVTVLATTAADATHPSVWGPLSSPQSLMTAVKREFDPLNILNPDRFVYA